MMPEPRQICTTGISALTADGGRGRVRQALLNRGHLRLVALVVRYGGLLTHDVVVPIEQVADMSDRQVRLRLRRTELAQQPAYQSAARIHSAPGGPRRALAAIQYGGAGTSERILHMSASEALALAGPQSSPPAGLLALRAGQPVRIGAQQVGRLARLLLDSDRHVREMVVRTNRLFGRHVIVPIEHVARCDAQGISLTLDRAAFDQLPDYRTDHVIARDVRQALWDDALIRRLDRQSIDAMVGAGAVMLRGHTTTPVSRARAERAVLGVRGVRRIMNQIVTDGELQIAVAQALAHDERTRGYRPFVHVQRGVVFVSGEDSNPAARAAIEAVAGSVPHVRAVVHDVEGNGATEDLRALFPRIGQDVYTSETRLGLIEQVIIHPRHRRVTAMVVRAWMADPQRERRLVIPASAVREVTEAAVLLDIGNDVAMRSPDFDPAAYARPMPDWQPPYPYTDAEVFISPDRPGAAQEWRDRSARPEEHVLSAARKEAKHAWQTANYTT